MKKLLIAAALLGGLYFAFGRNKEGQEATVDKGFAVSMENDPNGGVYIVIGGKKYGVSSEAAFIAYGYMVPQIVSKSELDAIPDGGFIAANGAVVRN